MKVMHVDRVLNDVIAEVIGRAVNQSPLDSTAGAETAPRLPVPQGLCKTLSYGARLIESASLPRERNSLAAGGAGCQQGIWEAPPHPAKTEANFSRAASTSSGSATCLMRASAALARASAPPFNSGVPSATARASPRSPLQWSAMSTPA